MGGELLDTDLDDNFFFFLFDIKRNMREAGDTSRVKELFKQQSSKSTPVYLTRKYSTFSSVLQLPSSICIP